MMSFGQMEAIKDKIKVVVNRVGLDNHIGLKKAQETIGREIFWQLPNDYRVMVEVRNNGVPLIEQAPKATITHSMISLAEALCGDSANAGAGGDPNKTTTVEKLLNLWPGRGKVAPKQPAPKQPTP
jgi:pilus assembly protein CpaE